MLPDVAQFASAIVTNPRGYMEGHMFIISPNPRPLQRSAGVNEMALARVRLKDWDASEQERAHFVYTKDDPALGAYLLLAKQHVQKLSDLASIMN